MFNDSDEEFSLTLRGETAKMLQFLAQAQNQTLEDTIKQSIAVNAFFFRLRTSNAEIFYERPHQVPMRIVFK